MQSQAANTHTNTNTRLLSSSSHDSVLVTHIRSFIVDASCLRINQKAEEKDDRERKWSGRQNSVLCCVCVLPEDIGNRDDGKLFCGKTDVEAFRKAILNPAA